MKRWSRDRPATFAWYDVTWYDMTWHDGARCDMTWRHYMTWHYVIWHDVTWRAMTWHEVHHVAWRGMTWHDVTWRDMTWHDVPWHDVTWYDVTRRDMTWHDVKWCDIMRHNATWRDMMRRDVRQHDVTWREIRISKQQEWTLLHVRWLRYCRKTIKTFLGLKLLIKPKSVQNTDFVTQLGKWISAVPEPFRMKFSRNVEKLFPKFKFVSDLNYLLPFRSYCQKSESTREILTKFSLFLAFFSARWRPKNFKTTGLFKLH